MKCWNDDCLVPIGLLVFVIIVKGSAMKKYKTLMAAGIALSLCSVPSQAASILSLMNTYGDFVLEDDSGESHQDFQTDGTAAATDGNNLLDVGESLRGIITFPFLEPIAGGSIPLDGISNETISAVFEAEVTSKVNVGTDAFGNDIFDYTFGPSASFAAEFGDVAGAMVRFYTDPVDNVDITGDSCDEVAEVVAGGVCEGTVTDGSWLMTMGFTGDPDEGWFSFDTPENTTVGASFATTTTLGTFNYNLGLVSAIPGVFFNQVLASPLADPNPFADDNLVTFAGSGSLLGTNSAINGDRLSGFGFTNDADITLSKQIPEPAGIALFGLAALGLAGFKRRAK